MEVTLPVDERGRRTRRRGDLSSEANGQEARYIEEMFTSTDTSDFVGSVRCTALPEEGTFTGVAVELDASNQIFTTLPVVPVPKRDDFSGIDKGGDQVVQGLSRSREDGSHPQGRVVGGRRSGSGRPSGSGVRLWAAGLGTGWAGCHSFGIGTSGHGRDYKLGHIETSPSTAGERSSGWGQSPAPAPRVPAHAAPAF